MLRIVLTFNLILYISASMPLNLQLSLSFISLSLGSLTPMMILQSHLIQRFEQKGQQRNTKDSTHQSALHCSRPWTYFAPLNTLSVSCCADLALTFKASPSKKNWREERRDGRWGSHGQQCTKRELKGVAEHHTDDLNLTPSTVSTSHY